MRHTKAILFKVKQAMFTDNNNKRNISKIKYFKT